MLAMETAQAGAVAPAAEDDHALLVRRRKEFEDYTGQKSDEIKEQRQARLYYHGSQWTSDQLKELKRRKAPATTSPLFARKINGFVGLVERLRQDPKAYPRTPKEAKGADLSTAALRYALDQQEWQAKSPIVSMHGAVDGIGGIELNLEPGDGNVPGDFDISLDYVEPDTFFYDPRSFRHDFSDARFMGVSKWLDVEQAKEQFPEKADQIDGLSSDGDEFTIESEREIKWFNSDLKQVRVVEHWYRKSNKWFWCFYTSRMMLDHGEAYLQDEKGRDICRFIMWRAFVDQDGDSYSFFRYMKSLIDEINQRNSKALHLLSMRRVIMEAGAVADVEQMRREAVRPDGVIIRNKNFELEFEDAKSLADMKGQLEMKQAAATELENFGPNPALVGQGVEAKSGKAIQLLQQAGIAELGPFIISYRSWKIRVYRAVWNAIRQHWKAERWIRVTDDDGQAQPVQVNGVEQDPMTGAQTLVNQIGALDVDIIIDEGPDTITMMADALETLQAAMANGMPIPPEALFELLPLPDSMKRKLIGLTQQAKQPDPMQQQAQQIDMAQRAANVEKTKAEAARSMAQAQQAMQPPQPEMGQPGPTEAELIETLASAEDKRAGSVLKYAQAEKVRVETMLAPQQMAAQARAAEMKAQQPRPAAR
jgi:hypothetical protein